MDSVVAELADVMIKGKCSREIRKQAVRAVLSLFERQSSSALKANHGAHSTPD